MLLRSCFSDDLKRELVALDAAGCKDERLLNWDLLHLSVYFLAMRNVCWNINSMTHANGDSRKANRFLAFKGGVGAEWKRPDSFARWKVGRRRRRRRRVFGLYK
jgi:hypothetical protein